MKLIAVYNVFDGEEFLEESIRSIRDYVDEIYAVCQTKSYNGIQYEGGYNKSKELCEIGLINFGLVFNTDNQLTKRQYCLDLAKEHGATHFLGMDCDEIYKPKEFAKAKEFAKDKKGTYCKIQTYFKERDLTIGLDNYYVPFIHSIDKDSITGSKDYPVTVDPRRSINGGAVEAPITMHHYSWVRDNIELKVNSHNSKQLIINNGILEDYYNAKEGSYIKHYDKILTRV